MKKTIYLLLAGLLGASVAQAESLASWCFSEVLGPIPPPRTIIADTKAAFIHTAQASMTDGLTPDGIGTAGWADIFSAIPWEATSLSAALADDEYLRITVTPQDGQVMDLTHIMMSANISCVMQGAVFSSAVGFSEGDEIGTLSFKKFFSEFSFYLNETEHAGLSTVEFRVYFYGAETKCHSCGVGRWGDHTETDFEVFGTSGSTAPHGVLFFIR